MLYYSMTTRHGAEHPRTCAIFEASGEKDAIRKARKFRDENMLCHIEKNAIFNIRRSSRNEINLLQEYLASCNIPEQDSYPDGDLEPVLNRRNTLLINFFIALYYNPELIKRKIASDGSPLPIPTPPSDGETQEASESEQENIQEEPTSQTDKNNNIFQSEETETEAEYENQSDDQETSSDEIAKNSSQNILDNLLGQETFNDTQDRVIELDDPFS